MEEGLKQSIVSVMRFLSSSLDVTDSYIYMYIIEYECQLWLDVSSLDSQRW